MIFFLLTKSGDLLFYLLETSLLNNATNYKKFIFKKLVKIVSYMTKLHFKISVSILKVIEAFTLTDCIFLFTILTTAWGVRMTINISC